MQTLFETFDPILVFSLSSALFLFALIYMATQYFSEAQSRSEIKKRLAIRDSAASRPNPAGINGSKHSGNQKRQISSRVAGKVNDFYVNSDPNSVKKIRMLLIQAGYMNPSALGYFIAARFGLAFIGLVFGGLLVVAVYSTSGMGFKVCVIVQSFVLFYFLPNFYLNRRAAAIELSNRRGFPDILDLMVVSAEAGLTMEASIERIIEEIRHIYPNLATQLNMTSLEIRAGRPIDEALRSFGERLRLNEVKSFATMIQQARELGTSVSDALRVYSEEMRHARMMKAEEKAYALPAKMSVPVTLFILPIVIGIAVIPTIVRWNI